MKKPHDEEAADDFGPVEIPDQTSFFFLLSNTGLSVLSSRRNDLTKTMKFLAISSIKPITKTKMGLSGGVEDLGNFKEGFCWKVNADNDGEEVTWIMCTLDLFEKETWMTMIAEVKGKFTVFEKSQGLEGEATLGGGSLEGKPVAIYDQTGPDGEGIDTTLSSENVRPGADGIWVPLQDWSTCTLACGGGTKTLHRKCVWDLKADPEEIKPCKGDPIVVEPCNEEPCPPPPGEESEEDLPLKVKIMKVSDRPQTYETCIIKEGDMEIIRSDLDQFVRPPRVPARVVLNNMTLTVFQTTKYDDVLFTSELDDLVISEFADDEGCFKAKNENTDVEVTLCTLASVTHITLKQNRDEWIKQIGFFRDHCR